MGEDVGFNIHITMTLMARAVLIERNGLMVTLNAGGGPPELLLVKEVAEKNQSAVAVTVQQKQLKRLGVGGYRFGCVTNRKRPTGCLPGIL